jgi:hypothetical protein
MGDAWEEERLERRDEYSERHRLKLTKAESDQWYFLNHAQEALMNEMTVFTKTFKAALAEIQELDWVPDGLSLRQIYVKLTSRSLLPGSNLSDARDISEWVALGAEHIGGIIAMKAAESEPFGLAVSSIAGVNRCINDYNSVRDAQFQLSETLYLRVFPFTGLDVKHIRWGETTSVETTDEQVHLLNLPSRPESLREISLDLSIKDLSDCRAIGHK